VIDTSHDFNARRAYRYRPSILARDKLQVGSKAGAVRAHLDRIARARARDRAGQRRGSPGSITPSELPQPTSTELPQPTPIELQSRQPNR